MIKTDLVVKSSFYGNFLTLKNKSSRCIFLFMKKMFFICIVVLSVAGIVACDSNRKFPATRKDSPVNVKLVVAQPAAILSLIHYSGSLQESSFTVVSFSVPGTVKSVHVAEGKRVTKGSLVATLDESSAKNALEIATALKLQAEDARARMEKLYLNKSISDIQWMDVESKYKQAVASEKLARKNLEDCKLYAPATGVVSGKSLEVGQNVAPGVPVFKIVDVAKIKAKAFVPEKEISDIHVGDDVQIVVGALGDKTFKGKITNKGISANVLSRTYEIEAEIANKDKSLLPGMLAEISLAKKDSISGVAIPASAILLDEHNKTFVWTVSKGRAKRCNVEVGLNDAGSDVLVQGLENGDSVIVSGMQKVGRNTLVVAK